MNKKKSSIQKHVDTVFSLVFTSVFRSEPMARSVPPLLKREPRMPQEILDLID